MGNLSRNALRDRLQIYVQRSKKLVENVVSKRLQQLQGMLHWPMFRARYLAKASHEKLHIVTVSHSTCLSHADEAYQAETAVHVHTFRVIRLRKPKDHRTAVSQRPSRFTPCYTIKCYFIKEV